jgi:hypothetical protein
MMFCNTETVNKNFLRSYRKLSWPENIVVPPYLSGKVAKALYSEVLQKLTRVRIQRDSQVGFTCKSTRLP